MVRALSECYHRWLFIRKVNSVLHVSHHRLVTNLPPQLHNQQLNSTGPDSTWHQTQTYHNISYERWQHNASSMKEGKTKDLAINLRYFWLFILRDGSFVDKLMKSNMYYCIILITFSDHHHGDLKLALLLVKC